MVFEFYHQHEQFHVSITNIYYLWYIRIEKMLFHHADSSLFVFRKFDFCKIKQKSSFKLTTSYIKLDRIWPNNFFLCVPKCWKAFTFHPYKGGMIKGKKGPFEKQEQNQEVHAGWVLKGMLKGRGYSDSDCKK